VDSWGSAACKSATPRKLPWATSRMRSAPAHDPISLRGNAFSIRTSASLNKFCGIRGGCPLADIPRALTNVCFQGKNGHDAGVMGLVIAITECTVARLEKRVVVRVLHDEPAFSALFLTYLLARNVRMEADLVDQLFNSSEKRLARLLLLLANFGKEGKPEPVIAKVNQETLAEMIGTTRSRVSFFMNKFRRLGFIEYNGGLHVHSSLLNVILHD
jgi:Crp-like helix-turn-helix domain